MISRFFKLFVFILFVISIFSYGFSIVSINTCQIINETLLDSSRVVELSSNIDFSSGGNCIEIKTSNMTLDCRGFSIAGSSTTNGLYANGYYNNLTISNCNFVGNRPYVNVVSNSKFSNINVTNGNFEVTNSYTGTLGNNTINNIRVIGGYLKVGGKNITASNLFVTGSPTYGYTDNAVYSEIINLTSVNNTGDGYRNVRHGSGPSYNNYRNLNLSNNGGYGIYNNYAQGNKFYSVVGNNNGNYGYHMRKSSNSGLYNSTFNNNTGWDVLIDPEIWTGHCGHVTDNVTVTGGGLVEYYKNSNSITIENKNLGALIFCNVDSSTITNITISGGNNLNGIFIKYSDSNVFDKIYSSNNYKGFYLESTNSNTFTNSIFKNNLERDFAFEPFLSNNHNYKYSGNVCVQTLTNVTGTGDLPIGFYTGSSTVSDSNFNELIFCNSESISASNIEVGVVDGLKNGGLFVYSPANSNFSNINVTDSTIGLHSHYSNWTIFDNLYSYNNSKGLYVDRTTNTTFMNSYFMNSSDTYLFNYYYYNYDNIFKNNYFESGVSGFLEVYSPSYNGGLFYNNIINATNYYVNAYKFAALTYNISKTFGTSIVSGPYLGGNYWANPSGTGLSQTCTDIDKDSICDSIFTDGSYTFDELPLTNSYQIFIGQTPECYYNSSWQSCTNLDFSDNLEQIRNVCVSNIGSSISGMTVSLKNIDDNKYYFENSAMTFSSGNYSLSSINSVINDSGDFVFEFKCTDLLSNIIQNDFDFNVAYGDLLVELLTPSTNISVLQNSTFNLGSKVTCLSRECGDLSFAVMGNSGAKNISTILQNNWTNYTLYELSSLDEIGDSCSTTCSISGDYCRFTLGFDFPFDKHLFTSGTEFDFYEDGYISIEKNWNYGEIDFLYNENNDFALSNVDACTNEGTAGNKYAILNYDATWKNTSQPVSISVVLYEDGNILTNFNQISDTTGFFQFGLWEWDSSTQRNYIREENESILDGKSYLFNYGQNDFVNFAPINLISDNFKTLDTNSVNKSSLTCLGSMYAGDSCSNVWNLNATGDLKDSYDIFSQVVGEFGEVNSPSIFVNISTVSNLKEAYFIEPTNSLVQTANNWSFINVSSNVPITSCQLNWSGVLEPMSSSSSSCYINKTEMDDSLISYSVVVDIGSENLTTIVQQFDFVDSISVPVSEPIGTSVAALPSFGLTSLVVVIVSSLLFLI